MILMNLEELVLKEVTILSLLAIFLLGGIYLVSYDSENVIAVYFGIGLILFSAVWTSIVIIFSIKIINDKHKGRSYL